MLAASTNESSFLERPGRTIDSEITWNCRRSDSERNALVARNAVILCTSIYLVHLFVECFHLSNISSVLEDIILENCKIVRRLINWSMDFGNTNDSTKRISCKFNEKERHQEHWIKELQNCWTFNKLIKNFENSSKIFIWLRECCVNSIKIVRRSINWSKITNSRRRVSSSEETEQKHMTSGVSRAKKFQYR